MRAATSGCCSIDELTLSRIVFVGIIRQRRWSPSGAASRPVRPARQRRHRHAAATHRSPRPHLERLEAEQRDHDRHCEPDTPNSGRCAVCTMLTMSVFCASRRGDDRRRERHAHDGDHVAAGVVGADRAAHQRLDLLQLCGVRGAARLAVRRPALVGDEHRHRQRLMVPGRRDEGLRAPRVLVGGRGVVLPAPPCGPGTISRLLLAATACLSGSTVAIVRSTWSKLIAAATCTRGSAPTICADVCSAFLAR